MSARAERHPSALWDKTLADEPSIALHFAVDPSVFDPDSPYNNVYAPCCGRVTPAMTVIDVRSVRGTIARGGNKFARRDHDWLCDGCMQILVADQSNDWTHSRLLEARGAPAQLIHEYRTRELAHEARRRDDAAVDENGQPKPIGHEPERAYADARTRVEADHRAGILDSLADWG